MSLTRRLRRLVRSHLGALRGDPLDDEAPAGSTAEPSAASGAAGPPSSDPAVPPAVAEAYRALEVPVGSDRDTVKRGYRRVMKRYHQDRFENDERRDVAGEVSKRLNLAYDRVLEYLEETGR